MSSNTFDFLIVGAGIVGLTVASRLSDYYPRATICVLEKELDLGMHASGRNSGVLHCGIYYGNDTLKAKLCAEGARRMVDFAISEKISINKCGKVILATREDQLPTVHKLMKNASDNFIHAELVDQDQLHELEPYAAEGFAAIHCPDTAVIDSHAVLSRIKAMLIAKGVMFEFGTEFTGRNYRGNVNTKNSQYSYGKLFNCAGAYADKVAKAFGLADEYALVPFKGIYWKLSDNANHKVKANIYPVPDVSIPFLGVHLTRTISDDVYVGPTAIPAIGRENYGILTGANIGEAMEIGAELAGMYFYNENNFRTLAHAEMGKYIKSNFLAAAQKLLPSLTASDMVPATKVGIRPQLINKKTRKLEMDYILESTEDSIHVLNAISPAFTCSFAFSELIISKAGL